MNDFLTSLGIENLESIRWDYIVSAVSAVALYAVVIAKWPELVDDSEASYVLAFYCALFGLAVFAFGFHFDTVMQLIGQGMENNQGAIHE